MANITQKLEGPIQVSLNKVTVPSKYISDDGATVTTSELAIEHNTMAGNYKTPAGIFDEVSATFSFELPNMDYLQNVLPDLYESASGNGVSGHVKIGGDDCVVRSNTKLVIHTKCDSNANNDIYFPNAAVILDGTELERNQTDPVKLEVTVDGNPDDSGVRAYFGPVVGSKETIWNASTESYVSAS